MIQETKTVDEVANLIQQNQVPIVLVDARFTHEYDGGHIAGAVNVKTPQEMIELYNRYIDTGSTIIMYCEFGVQRSRALQSAFRDYDRAQHTHNYPNLSYPNVYVIERGYKEFFQCHPELCVGGYVQMRDRQFLQELRSVCCENRALWDNYRYSRTNESYPNIS